MHVGQASLVLSNATELLALSTAKHEPLLLLLCQALLLGVKRERVCYIQSTRILLQLNVLFFLFLNKFD